jgi:hypothetical protein
MARISLNKITDERRLLLPLVSAQNYESPVVAPITISQHRFCVGTKSYSHSIELSVRAFKVFSTDGC